jgi:hypothetical protein
MKATHHPRNLIARHLDPPATADPELTPALLLRGAALYLQRHGRTTGEFFDLLSDEAFPPACAGGAVNIAAHGRPILSSDDGTEDAVTDAAITALRVFAAYLDTDYATGSGEVSAIDIVAAFNDDPNRTDQEVPHSAIAGIRSGRPTRT